MPITAKFDADFSSFYEATAKAQTSLNALGASSEKTQGFTKGLASSLGQFDRVLASAGINISSQISALNEISSAIGKTTSELGLFTTAGLAAGAAMAGWQFGRMIAGWLGTDKAIADATASLAGWGDVAAQTAGAQADVLAKASATAGRAITDLGEAMRINADAAREHTLAITGNESRVRTWELELKKVADAGHFQQMTAEMTSHNYSLKEVSERYGISAGALDYLTREMADNTEAAKAETEATNQLFKTWEEGDKIMQDFAIKTHQIAMQAMKDEREERAKLLAERNQQVIAGLEQLKASQAQYTDWVLKTTLSETEYKIAKIHDTADAQSAAFKGTEQQLEQFTAFVREMENQQVAAINQTTDAYVAQELQIVVI